MALEQTVHGKSRSVGNTNASAARDNDNDDPLAGMRTAPVSVEATCRMMQGILYDGNGEIGVVLGGVYQHIPHLRAIHPHGSMDVNFAACAALGSGGLAAMCILEQRCQPDL